MERRDPEEAWKKIRASTGFEPVTSADSGHQQGRVLEAGSTPQPNFIRSTPRGVSWVLFISGPLPHVSGYFWIHKFFFITDSKISPSTRSVVKSTSPVLMHPMVSGSTLEKLGLHLVYPISVYCSVRDWTRFCYVIGFGFTFFHSGERTQKYPDACGWKPYPERKSCGFKNIWIRVDGASTYHWQTREFSDVF